MAGEVGQNSIFPVIFNKNLQRDTFFDYRHFSADGYEVFAVASIYGSNIDSLEDHLDFALKQLEALFIAADSDILERMKKSIFDSGDRLASHLISLGYVVDDVDYSVCIVAFREGVFYLWMDGDLNVRVYRGGSSTLLNKGIKPQFFGSGTVELGDIFAISYNDFLRHEDDSIEAYVVEEKTPEYPIFLLDYQIDDTESSLDLGTNRLDGLQADVEVHVSDEAKQKVTASDGLVGSHNKDNDLKSYLRSLFGNVDIHSALQQIVLLLKTFLLKIWQLLMLLSSNFVDAIFRTIYGGNSPRFQRFQSSSAKVQLQYAFALILLISIGYFIFAGVSSYNNNQAHNQKNNTISNNEGGNDASLRNEIERRYSALNQLAVAYQLDEFNKKIMEFRTLLESASTQGFKDTEYINQMQTNATRLEDTVYQVAPIAKMDEIFSATHIPNVDIVDFSRVGNTIYALDRANSQVLVSNSATQQFDVFAADPELKALSHISCLQKSCYLVDEEVGIVILNLETRSFNKFSALRNAGKGVKEIATYLAGDVVYIYTLIPAEGKVLRYQRVGDGLSRPDVWNKDVGFGPNVTDIWVDGSIYEISNDGSLRKFYMGNLDPISSFGGLGLAILPLRGDLQLAMTPPRDPAPGVVNRVYVSDPTNERVVVFDRDLDAQKKLRFLGSYKFRGSGRINFGNLKEIDLSSDEKYLYGLSNNIVFKFAVTSL